MYIIFTFSVCSGHFWAPAPTVFGNGAVCWSLKMQLYASFEAPEVHLGVFEVLNQVTNLMLFLRNPLGLENFKKFKK